mgnify:CR=1 FL=1
MIARMTYLRRSGMMYRHFNTTAPAPSTSFFSPLTTTTTTWASTARTTQTTPVLAKRTAIMSHPTFTPPATLLQLGGVRFSSVLKKRKKKMRKHKLRKMRRALRRSNKN